MAVNRSPAASTPAVRASRRGRRASKPGRFKLIRRNGRLRVAPRARARGRRRTRARARRRGRHRARAKACGARRRARAGAEASSRRHGSVSRAARDRRQRVRAPKIRGLPDRPHARIAVLARTAGRAGRTTRARRHARDGPAAAPRRRRRCPSWNIHAWQPTAVLRFIRDISGRFSPPSRRDRPILAASDRGRRPLYGRSNANVSPGTSSSSRRGSCPSSGTTATCRTTGPATGSTTVSRSRRASR